LNDSWVAYLEPCVPQTPPLERSFLVVLPWPWRSSERALPL